MAQNGRFLACWASFFAEVPLEGRCWASFFAEMRLGGVLGEFFREPAVVGSHRANFVAPRPWSLGPSTGSVNPSIRSYTHLAEAGRGRPTRPQQRTPKRKALTKGSGSPVKAVTSLDNGRKWRVDAGRTLELLR